jgi:hypothetical protein
MGTDTSGGATLVRSLATVGSECKSSVFNGECTRHRTEPFRTNFSRERAVMARQIVHAKDFVQA